MQAKEEFLQAFKTALSKFIESESPIPSYIEDTPAVKQAKDEFFHIFNDALEGILENVYLEDTEEVKNAKGKFFDLFEDALNNSQKTVKQSYLEDTAEVREAKEKFQQAFEDAKIGKTGRQFIENTAEVKIARKRFFQFYEFVLVGMLERLAPKPGQNSLPPQVGSSCAGHGQAFGQVSPKAQTFILFFRSRISTLRIVPQWRQPSPGWTSSIKRRLRSWSRLWSVWKPR